MDGKHTRAIFKQDERVGLAAVKEQAPNGSGPMIREHARRQHDADASAVARQMNGALDERLIQVHVSR